MDRNLFRRRQLLMYFGLGIAGVGAAAAAFPRSKGASSAASLTANRGGLQPAAAIAAVPSSDKTLPEFQGISAWLNSSPLTINELKGDVVLIQFWTFSCINCQRTLPYITRWNREYAAKGLKVVGVHTPEFAFEREVDNIKKALQQHQITYSVPVDNEYKTWRAYGNNFWPHLYLADRQGILRYDHVGEGAYEETEQTIRQLLG